MSRVPGDKDQDLLQKKGGNGFPYLIFMDAEGNVLSKHEGERDAAGFAETGKKVQAFMDLKKKAEKGDKATKIDFLIAQLELGQVAPAEAEKKLKDLGKPTKQQQAKLDGAMVNAAVMDVMKTVEDDASAKEAGKKFYAMKKMGRAAPTSDEAVQPYWILMMDAAAAEKDAATFEDALKALKAKFGDNPRAQQFFKQKEEQLQKLKEEKKDDKKK